MDTELYIRLLATLSPLLLVLVGYLVGSTLESRHFASIREREEHYRAMPTITFETLPEGWRVAEIGFASGNVVVSLDYFKRMLAGLRALVGGRIRFIEPLLDRGRREAVLRMQQRAAQLGFEAIINVRLETSQLDSSGRSGIAGVEILAYGTAIKFDRSSPKWMQFTPKTPDEGVNYARENPLREALLLAAIVAGALLVILFGGSWAAEEIAVRTPPAWEAKLFGFMAKHFDSDSQDARAQRVSDLLASLDPEAAQTVTLRILDDDQLNAFAAPGGLILVTSGLLDAVKSENELAFVLGHELGHFRHRDHLRSMGRGLGASLSMALLSATIGTDISSIGWLQDLANLRFSRQQERRADDWGIELTAKRYGHVAGATAFFERLPHAESAIAQGAESFLSSHPVSADRIERLERLAGERGWNAEGSLTSFP